MWNKIYKHKTHIFEEIVDQLKKHIRLEHAGIVDFGLIYRHQNIFLNAL